MLTIYGGPLPRKIHFKRNWKIEFPSRPAASRKKITNILYFTHKLESVIAMCSIEINVNCRQHLRAVGM